MMRADGRALLLGATLLTCLAGGAAAAEDKGTAKAPAHGRSEAAPSAESVGAGGLTGSGATKDGARTGAPDTDRSSKTSAPAAGTAR